MSDASRERGPEAGAGASRSTWRRRLDLASRGARAGPEIVPQQVHPLLCFDRSRWLHEEPRVARDVRGFWASDEAIVDAIAEAIEAFPPERPFFVFGFPSSTHHPYDHDGHADSTLDVVDPPPGLAGREVRFYVNALRAADRALARLVARLERLERRTLLVVLGDHVPPLSDGALLRFYAGTEGRPHDAVRRQHRVPLLLWSNFPRERRRVELSLNALAPLLLRELGIAPTGFLGFVDEFRVRVPVFSRRREDREPVEHRAWIEDYALLQWDLLLGEQAALHFVHPARPEATIRP